MTGKAPSGGWKVNLLSSLPEFTYVPASITIPAGSDRATFMAGTVAHSRTLLTMVRASDASSTRQASLSALGDGISRISLFPKTVVGGDKTTVRIDLLYPAPAWGWTVHLQSSAPSFVTLPISITLPAGATSGSCEISTIAHGRTLVTSVRAYDQTSDSSASLTALGDAISGVTLNPAVTYGGNVSTGTVTLLHPAPAWGWTVHLTSSLAAFASVPASITVPEGASAGSFSVETAGSSRDLTMNITARDQTSQAFARVTTKPNTLSDSPWPRFQGTLTANALGTGSGAVGKLSWGYSLDSFVVAAPVIGKDGTIYVGCTDNRFYAFAPDGLVKWTYLTNGIIEDAAAVASDGTIYVGSNDGNLYALNENGTLKWKYSSGFASWYSCPAVGADGTIYDGNFGSLLAIAPNGTLKWQYSHCFSGASPTIGADGTIYIGDTDSNFYAFQPDGNVKWSINLPEGLIGTAAIAADGTLYAECGSGIYALTPTGKTQWSFSLPISLSACAYFAIGPDGTIYSEAGSFLTALHPDGSLKWQNQISVVWPYAPVVGSDGTIYVGTGPGSPSGNPCNVSAFHPDGSVKWVYQTGQPAVSFFAIGADGTLYYGAGHDTPGFYALH